MPAKLPFLQRQGKGTADQADADNRYALEEHQSRIIP
jgi:hypothetical protein